MSCSSRTSSTASRSGSRTASAAPSSRPEGDIISPNGILTGGSSNGAGEKSLLRNRREIAELTEEVERLWRPNSRSSRNGRKRTASLIAQWDEELLRIRSQLHLTELRINGLRKDVERFDGEMRQVGDRLKVLEFNRENLRSEAAEAREKSAKHEAEMKALEEREAALNQAMAADRERWEALRADLEEREGVLTEQKIRLASLEEKREADLKTLARLEASLADHSREIAARIADAEHLRTGGAGARRRRSPAEEETLKGLYAECEALEAALSAKRGSQPEKEALLRAREAEIREVKKSLDRLAPRGKRDRGRLPGDRDADRKPPAEHPGKVHRGPRPAHLPNSGRSRRRRSRSSPRSWKRTARPSRTSARSTFWPSPSTRS